VRGSAARVALPALALLGLAAVVAVASGGRTPSGTSGSRPVPDVLFDSIISIGLVLLIPAAAIFVYGLLQRKAVAAEIQRRKYPRFGLAGWIAFVLLFAFFAWFRGRNWEPPTIEDELGDRAFPGGNVPTTTSPDGAMTYEPEFAWIPVVAVSLLASVAVAAFLLSTRRRAAQEDDALAEAIAGVLDETLDDLRAEADPRRAVVAAFARLEKTFASNGLPRERSETAEEYVERTLGVLNVGGAPARRLAVLFEVAKFSHHDVDAGMKEEAISALEEVRNDLRRAREPDRTSPLAETSPA
jgi:hypothetical protein